MDYTLGASYGARPGVGAGTQLFNEKGTLTRLTEWADAVAVVMPPCTGKSTLCHRFSGFDIDDIVADSSPLMEDSELDEMLTAREAGLVQGDRAQLAVNNRLMLQRAERFFAVVRPDDNAHVIFCHTAELAEALGLRVLTVAQLPDHAIEASSRMIQASPLIRSVTMRTMREVRAANLEYARRHGLHVTHADSYSGLQAQIGALLMNERVLGPCAAGHAYWSLLDRNPSEKVLLERSMSLLRDKHLPGWVRAVAARRLRLIMEDSAPIEGQQSHNHQVWAQIVHATFSARAGTMAAVVPDWTEEQWRAKYPFGPGNATFALSDISTWVEVTGPQINEEGGWEWFRQLCNLDGPRYERVLGALAFGDIANYVIPQHRSLLNALPLGSLDDEAYATITKMIHNHVRAGMSYLGVRLTPADLPYFAYFDCLSGRLMGKEDIDAEIRDRTSPPSPKRFWEDGRWSTSSFDRRFTEAVAGAYDHLSLGLGNTLKRMGEEIETFENFLENRRKWVRPGAATGAPKADIYLKVPADHANALDDVAEDIAGMTIAVLRRVRLNKSALFEFPEFVSMVQDAVKNYKPNSFTKHFFKHEPGKTTSRALFPAHLTHYIMVSHILYLAEKGAEIPNTRLTAGPGAQQADHWMWRRAHDTSVHLMLDYANFNETHTIKDMQTIILGLRDVYARHFALSPALEATIKWVVESFERIMFEHEGNLILFTHGLLSGWRCTTWVNSIANKAYLQVIGEQVELATGMPAFVEAQSGGDDVAAEASSLYDVAMTLRIGKAMGFEFKDLKQLTGYRAREFFRLFVAEEGVYGSLCRMLGSALSGQWSNSILPKFIEPAAKLSSVIEVARKAGRRARSLTFMEKMATCAFAKWATEGEVALAESYVHGTVATGGLGIPTVFGDVYELDGVEEVREKPMPVGIPTDASRPIAQKMVQEASDTLGPEAVVDITTLAMQMAAGGFISSVAQSRGPGVLRIAGSRRVPKVLRVKRIRQENLPPEAGSSARYAEHRASAAEWMAAQRRAGARYNALAQAVKPPWRRKLAEKVCREIPGAEPEVVYYWKEELQLYGCATYLLTEDYYEDVVLLAMWWSDLNDDSVSYEAAILANGLAADGYMYY